MRDYPDYTDETLIICIRHGDSDAQDYLISKYKNLVKVKARAYFIIGADKEDIIQEGMIGLYKAIRDFNSEKQVSFYSFAELCVTRQIITAIKAATRQKHIPLNSSISLNRTISDTESENTYIDVLMEYRSVNPEDVFISREEKNLIEECIEEVLSVMECRVLNLFLQGKSYIEIARIISKDEKSIDNALQRVRRKLEKVLLDNNLTGFRKYARM